MIAKKKADIAMIAVVTLRESCRNNLGKLFPIDQRAAPVKWQAY